MEFLKNMLARYAKDRGVWVAVATFVSHFLSRKFGLNVDAAIVTDLLVALATWGLTHFLHVKTVDKPKIEVPEVVEAVDNGKIEVPEFKKENKE